MSKVIENINKLKASLDKPRRLDLTGDYTLMETDLDGSVFLTNQGAGSNIELQLPPGAEAMTAHFRVRESHDIKLNAHDPDRFRHGSVTGASGGFVRSATPGDFWTIEYFNGEWVITALSGILKGDE